MTVELRSLIEEVQKFILAKRTSRHLYVSEEAFSFFAKEVPYTPPPPPIKAPPPPTPKPIIEEKVILPETPTYDYKQLKDLMGTLKPGLKIIEEAPASCLIIGPAEYGELMEAIKKAIEENLKKRVQILNAIDESLLSAKSVRLAIISSDLSSGAFRTAEPLNYLAGVPTLRADFRTMKNNPEEKRALWNAIKQRL
jgi:hypothetical protein